MINNMYLDLLFLGLVVGCAEVMQVSAGPLDVCRAVQVKSARALTVRGTGEIGRDGLVIGDVTCSVAKSGELKFPRSSSSMSTGPIPSNYRQNTKSCSSLRTPPCSKYSRVAT